MIAFSKITVFDSYSKRMLIVFLFFMSSLSVKATHIIGGYFEYTYLGADQYQVHLVVYRDCYNGVPPFDSPASFGVFDNSNTFLFSVDVFPSDSNSIFVQGGCIPGNVCITKANYYQTLTLPPNTAYTIAYQRCCRSNSVLNIVDPIDYGITIYCTIDPQYQNNSPNYLHEYAAFTYVGDNFSFDASAVDPDGDQLVYSLDDAHDGATAAVPVPNPPSAPPYLPLTWQAPYSMNDMIGGPTPLSIDASTGMITAIPGTLGVFVLSYKIEEYRSGNLIGTQRKEFVLAVNPGSYFDGSGMVFADNGATPLDTGKSWLIRLNLADSTLTAVDTNDVVNGNYLHPQAINGVYLVKGSADSTSIYYANNIPTYYGDVLYWYDATEVTLCSANTTGININLVQGVNPGGPGFIGGLISQGANRSNVIMGSLEGITVILYDQSNQPVAYDVTDGNGAFEISNLPLGTYKVYIDRLNYYVDNSIAPSITLTPTTPSLPNQSFSLHKTWLEHLGTVGEVDDNTDLQTAFVFPNPTSNDVTVSYELKQDAQVEVNVCNALGQTLISDMKNLSAGYNELFVETNKIPAGVYYLKISVDGKVDVRMLVKM